MPKLLMPSTNWIPTAPRELLLDSDVSMLRMSMEQMNQVAVKGGYDGLELSDGRLIRHANKLERAKPETAQKLGRMVHMLYESFRQAEHPWSPENIRTGIRNMGPAYWLGSTAVFRTGDSSLNHLERIAHKIGRPDVPYVLYADQSGDRGADRAKTERFKNALIQPTAELMALWGIDGQGPSALIRELQHRRYRAMWGGFPGDRQGKNTLSRMQQSEFLPALLSEGMIGAVAVSGYRSDFKHVDSERYDTSIQEGDALLGLRELDDLPLGAMFRYLREAGWQGHVINRLPFSGIAPRVANETFGSHAAAHRAATQTIRHQLPHIVWNTPVE